VKRSRPRTPVGAVSASIKRRRALREPRVVVRDSRGELRTLARDDAAAQRLQDAAEALISAAQSGSSA
jgi:hypothetical protein